MNIFRLLRDGPPASRRMIFVFAGLTGLGNAGLVGLVNEAAEQSLFGFDVEPRLLVVYVLTLLFFLISNRSALKQANRFVQSRLEATRRRIVRKIRMADLRTLERLGKGDIYVTVAQETDHLSQTLPLLIGAAQSALLVLFLFFYIASISLISFFVIAAFSFFGARLFMARQRALTASLGEVHHREAEMLDSLMHFTLGFQEIRLNADKNEALYNHFSGVTDRLKDVVTELGGRWVTLLQFSNAFIFLLVGIVVFVLPVFFDGYDDSIYKITAASVFALGPIAAIFSVVRLIGRAEAGLGHVYALEKKLDHGASLPIEPRPRQRSAFRSFSKIELAGVEFKYVDLDGGVSFKAGPLDLALHRGEIVFLTGGNGSGKSTALKLLTGLYTPDAGQILCDGIPVEDTNRQEYREIFSCVFTDFHLFDRLYGIGDVEPEEVERLIERMQLSGKVGFENDRFTTRDLSTGQRKRLALIVGMLEDREVYIFDEWAADQDAHFREKFYSEILPDFKARGKTVLAVTHDDHYWHHCDRRIVLDLGMILPDGER
ncbi:cyclic peptide export ABC transporter [Labrenzia sp. DG1229]|uniref:cyclic peptide export ABC transporter n=1 Tax=Labrenzia sp. DG1229 TaxID=681847 RepID=UPI00068CD721|nr:cyclic peptide export ABC transporter [Labrenzia sp. DG1229]